MSARHGKQTFVLFRGLPLVVLGGVLGSVLGSVLGHVLGGVLGHDVPGNIVAGILCGVIYAVYGQEFRSFPLWVGFCPGFSIAFSDPSSTLKAPALLALVLSFMLSVYLCLGLVAFLKSRRTGSP